MGAEFVRGRVCQGPSLLGAEMSRNRSHLSGFNSICQTGNKTKMLLSGIVMVELDIKLLKFFKKFKEINI